MNKYAENTSVDVDRSIGEIKRTLQRFGADRFAYSEEASELKIAFRIRGFSILMRVLLPSQEEFASTEKGRTRTASAQFSAWEQECRRRARSLAAVIKAKLIAIDDQVATLEQEFLPYIVVDGVRTIGEYLVPRLPEITSGKLALPARAEG
jgi:hypothetical protein